VGDRCYISIKFRRADLPIFEEILGKDVFEELDGGAQIVVGSHAEANYGWTQELEELAQRNIPFSGFHGKGSEYSAEVFAACNGLFAEVFSDEQGDVMIYIDNTGKIHKRAKERVMEYYHILEMAEAALMQQETTNENT
jgi:hypothetical protein